MIKQLTVFLAFCLIQFVGSGPAKAEVELSICHQDTFGGKNWQRVSILQMAPFLRGDNEELELTVRRAVCNDTMPDTICAALPGRMFCRQAALRRMNIVATWYAYHFIAGGYGDYEEFRTKFDRPVAQAFRFADGAEASDEVTAALEPVRVFLERKLQGLEQDDVADQVHSVAEIQNRIMAFNMAALIGHEAHHMNGEVCPLARETQMETSGLFAHILETQTTDRLFCPSYPNPNEIKADRCAARQIEALQSKPIKSTGNDRNFEEFAQRAASDMIAFQALSGFRRFAQLPVGEYTIPDFDAYLNPVFRLALLSGSVSNIAGEPRLCGDSASLFVHGVQVGFQQCGGEGEVSDELLGLLPKAVENSWNGAPWTVRSFSCSEE